MYPKTFKIRETRKILEAGDLPNGQIPTIKFLPPAVALVEAGKFSTFIDDLRPKILGRQNSKLVSRARDSTRVDEKKPRSTLICAFCSDFLQQHPYESVLTIAPRGQNWPRCRLNEINPEQRKSLDDCLREMEKTVNAEDTVQSFYGFKAEVKEEVQRGKSKGKGKTGKGKGKQNDILPRFDLARQWPRRDITTWQAVLAALENGEAPRGEVCICKHAAQIEELQAMANALEIKKDLVLVCKHCEEDSTPKGASFTWMPYLGNLALIKATVANLNGSDSKIIEMKPKEVTIGNRSTGQITLRITVVMKYVPKEHHKTLYGRPDFALKLCGFKKELKTYKWESANGCINGYINCEESDYEEILQTSGKHAIFFTRLSQDITAKPAVTWIERNMVEKDAEYHERVAKLAEKEKVSMAHRRGGGSDLGIHKTPDGDNLRTWAMWGTPGWMGPNAVREWLEIQGWQIEGVPSEPRTKNGPWKIFGRHKDEPNNDEHAYKMEHGDRVKHISLVKWKPSTKKNSNAEATEKICNHRWYVESDAFEVQVSPTLPFEPDIAATLIDSQDTQAEENNDKDMKDGNSESKGKKTPAGTTISPVKKKMKIEETKVTGGMPGPDGTRTLDLGGTGDCAWRCLAFQLAMTNCSWKKPVSEVRPKVTQLAKALRAQTLHYLLNVDTAWKESWTIDDKWNRITEDGEPATNITDFMEVLQRPNRWICVYGLQAVCCLKKISLAIWKLTADGWTKIALMKPKERSEKAPVLGLVLTGGHYLALVRTCEKTGLPKDWAQRPGPCLWKSSGMTIDPIEASQEKVEVSMFRGGGFETPKRSRNSSSKSDQEMLRTCSSVASTHSKKSYYDNDDMDLLRTCSQRSSGSSKSPGSQVEQAEIMEVKLTRKQINQKRAILQHAPNATEFERRSKAMSYCKNFSFANLLKGETVAGIRRSNVGASKNKLNRRKNMGKLLALCTQHGLKGPQTIKQHTKKRIRDVWHCPFCTYKVNFSDKAAESILAHLNRFHQVEKEKAVERNLEIGATRPGGRSALRHGLGNNPLVEPVQLKPMPKVDTKFFCPYCLKGTSEDMSGYTLRKTKKFHLKQCKKAPPGTTLTQMGLDWRKNRAKVHKVEEQRLRTIERLKRRVEAAEKKGHEPIVVPHAHTRNWPDYSTLLCKHCLAGNKGQFWKRCTGTKNLINFEERAEVHPGTRWWEKMGRLNGMRNLFELLEIDANGKLAKRIQRDVHSFRLKSKNPAIITYRGTSKRKAKSQEKSKAKSC